MMVQSYAVFLLALTLGLSFLPSASAQLNSNRPAYTEQDIIERFAPENQGPPRGLCIGTEAECTTTPASDPTSVASPAPVFDLFVTFNYNSDVLTASAKQNLDEFAKALRNERMRNLSFLVEGHTDAKGSDTYNLNLSQRRAQAVVRYLTVQGVDGARLMARGYGETKPYTSDPFDPANRRVETRVNTTSAAEAKR